MPSRYVIWNAPLTFYLAFSFSIQGHALKNKYDRKCLSARNTCFQVRARIEESLEREMPYYWNLSMVIVKTNQRHNLKYRNCDLVHTSSLDFT
jgi:hypothetical protein